MTAIINQCTAALELLVREYAPTGHFTASQTFDTYNNRVADYAPLNNFFGGDRFFHETVMIRDMQFYAVACFSFNHPVTLISRQSHRLFTEHMFSMIHRIDADRCMKLI